MPQKSFRGDRYFLSNFYPCRNGVMYDGDTYPTSEHAYQAAKIEERDGRQSFICGGSVGDNPMKAKQKGKTVRKRPGWEAMKVDVMLEVLRSKFQRDTVLQDELLATRNETLRELGTGDTFWGGTRNHLGNKLMQVRRELREQRQQTIELMRQDDSDDSDVDARPKLKQRSKGNLQQQALFEQQLRAWDEADDASADHSELDSELDEQCVDAAPMEPRVLPVLSAEAQMPWVALGREAKAASERAANEEDVVQERHHALRAVVDACQRATALRTGFLMPLLIRSLAELASLESSMPKKDIEDGAAPEASAHLASDDAAAPAPTSSSVPQNASRAVQIQSCHDSSWHGWYCNACGTFVRCIDDASFVDEQCDGASFVDATCAEKAARRFRPRGGRNRWSRKYDADHRG